MLDPNCIFCRIASREIPATVVYENESCLAFRDLSAQAPSHVLLVPKRHVASLDALDDRALAGELLLAAAEVARMEGIAESGYRVVTNVGADGGQSVFHLHLHVLGGRRMTWPPG